MLWVLPLLVGCGSDNKTQTPAQPTPTLAAPTAKSPIGGAQLDTVRPTLEVNNAAATGTLGTVTYRFEVSEASDFPTGSRTVTADNIAQGSGTTKWDVPVDLIPNLTYSWRARATNGTITTDWSKTETFKTQNKGFMSGQTVFDPLTNGETVGERHGGHFVPGEGWQADTLGDSIDYVIPTLTSGKVEFDCTNFDRATSPVDVDLKWFSMGETSSFGNFQAFRDNGWKMHIEKKSADAGAVKLIWRTGCQGSQSCDHTDNPKIPIAWEPARVYHFTFQWGSGTFFVQICEGEGGCAGKTMYERRDTYPGSYAPPSHNIELGTRPRGETLIGARWRNVRINPF